MVSRAKRKSESRHGQLGAQPVQLGISSRLKNRVVCWNVNSVVSLSAVFSMWV